MLTLISVLIDRNHPALKQLFCLILQLSPAGQQEVEIRPGHAVPVTHLQLFAKILGNPLSVGQ